MRDTFFKYRSAKTKNGMEATITRTTRESDNISMRVVREIEKKIRGNVLFSFQKSVKEEWFARLRKL